MELIKKNLSIYISLSLLVILACGGGSNGGNNGEQPPASGDTTPDAFTFDSQSTKTLSTLIESNTITISGIDQVASISVTGGEYRINDGNYTAASGTTTVDDTITLRVLTSGDVEQTTAATLTIGGISGEFEVTTERIITRASNTACIAPEQAESSPSNLQLENAFPNLESIDSLVGLFQSQGDSSRWYAMSQNGRVYWFENSATATTLNDFADLSSLVNHSGEQGLLGMAFDPQYSSNGRVFFSYINNNSQSVIARLTNQGSLPLNTSNPLILLTLDQPASNHNGGNIAFGPDDYLYIGFGDGGGGGDTYNNGQNTQSLHSTIMRIDVSGNSYSIPTDNPFVNDSSILDEIYAYGLRNPWRWSFDRQTGELWVGDVGQNTYEEIDIVHSGDNLGWPIMEATHCFNASSCNSNGLTLPVAEYDHNSGGCSVTGGFVYRGQNIPSLQGHYIHGDFCSGTIRTVVREANQTYTAETLLSSGQSISSFAQDADGEVLVLSISGRIFRFVNEQAGGSNIPENLSDTGCFTSTQNKTYPDFVVPFDVQSKLWSDGEQKTRLFSIPDGATINTLADGDFEYPDGSILVKNFISDDTYLETRLFMKHVTGWAGYSYRWSDDQNDAVLVTGLSPEEISVNDIVHIIPSRGQCFECHTNAANISLGPEASQLDFEIIYPNGTEGNQLDALTGSGYLTEKPTSTQVTELVALDDTSASIDMRARSYLHANCSGCHRPGAPGSQLDFRIQTSLSETMACDQVPNSSDLGIDNARIIAAGESARSVLVARISTEDSNIRMPPIGTQVVHDDAVSVVRRWINSLTDCQ